MASKWSTNGQQMVNEWSRFLNKHNHLVQFAWLPVVVPVLRHVDSTSPRWISICFILRSTGLGFHKMKSCPQVKVRYQRLPDGEEEKDIMIV